MYIPHLTLDRTYQGKYQTEGYIRLRDFRNDIIFECKSLELPWRGNKKNISCIPPGFYIAKKHVSPKFGPCLWLQDVPDRSEILVHKGNYNMDTLGCILPGESFYDINGDGLRDVRNSQKTVQKLLSLLDDTVEMAVRNWL